MNFEKLSEQPHELSFIASLYAEQVGDKLSYDLLTIHEDKDSWEFQINDITLGEQRVGPTMHETQVFISALIEFLDEDYPQYDWKDMISITVFEGTFRIKFEAK